VGTTRYLGRQGRGGGGGYGAMGAPTAEGRSETRSCRHGRRPGPQAPSESCFSLEMLPVGVTSRSLRHYVVAVACANPCLAALELAVRYSANTNTDALPDSPAVAAAEC
jgi:hypothetical protein